MGSEHNRWSDASQPHSSLTRESLYIRCARFGLHSNERIFTTSKVFLVEIIGRAGVSHQWNNMSFIHEPFGLFPVEH
jgi:hypothetical protein